MTRSQVECQSTRWLDRAVRFLIMLVVIVVIIGSRLAGATLLEVAATLGVVIGVLTVSDRANELAVWCFRVRRLDARPADLSPR
jgi:hypothetical protein